MHYVVNIFGIKEGFMAQIITTQNCKRRTIRLSSNDVISIIKEYQQRMKGADCSNVLDVLGNNVFYLPEDL